jgi:hypothetical protein
MKAISLSLEKPLTINDLANCGVSRIPTDFKVNENGVLLEKTIPCIATIIVGELSSFEPLVELLQPEEDDTILIANASWRMPQLLKAIGAFDSTTTAAKNGWNKDIPFGYSEHKIKHSKVRGVIALWKE